MTAPCKGCDKRHTACHDSCEEYQAYKAAADAVRAKRIELNELKIVDYERCAKGHFSRWMNKYRRKR